MFFSTYRWSCVKQSLARVGVYVGVPNAPVSGVFNFSWESQGNLGVREPRAKAPVSGWTPERDSKEESPSCLQNSPQEVGGLLVFSRHGAVDLVLVAPTCVSRSVGIPEMTS